MKELIQRLRRIPVNAEDWQTIVEATDALEAAERNKPAANWQPINSAPKEGRIMVWNDMYGAYTSENVSGLFPLGVTHGMIGHWYPVPTKWMQLDPDITYTAPRFFGPRGPMTDEEIKSIRPHMYTGTYEQAIARAVEKHHGIG